MPISRSTRPTPPHCRQACRTAHLSALLCVSLVSCVEAAEPAPNLSEQLTDLIFDYRAQNGLPAIPVSPSMSTVAALHIADLERHRPTGQCSAHSWSADAQWSACCYTRDHAQAQCMWDKPGQITHGAYTGHGFEIVCTSENQMTPETAMDCWRHSAAHHAVILNRDAWRDTQWRALGIRVSQHYAVLWLGIEPDR
jgi:uncharacterized protein YkwD